MWYGCLFTVMCVQGDWHLGGGYDCRGEAVPGCRAGEQVAWITLPSKLAATHGVSSGGGGSASLLARCVVCGGLGVYVCFHCLRVGRYFLCGVVQEHMPVTVAGSRRPWALEVCIVCLLDCLAGQGAAVAIVVSGSLVYVWWRARCLPSFRVVCAHGVSSHRASALVCVHA